MSAIDRLRQRIAERQSAAPVARIPAAIRNADRNPAANPDDLLVEVPSRTPWSALSPPLSKPASPESNTSSKPAYVQLTPLPRPHLALSEKARTKTLKALKLSQADLILLCVPTGYTDATRACVRTNALNDGVRELLLLRSTGRMKVFDRLNNEVGCDPYGSWLDAPWPGYWSFFRRATIEFVDADGERLSCSVFAPAVAKALAQAGDHLVYAELGTFRRRSLQKAQPIDLEAIGCIYPSYATPGSATKNADIRCLVKKALGNPSALESCIRHLRQSTLMEDSDMLDMINTVPGCEDVSDLADFLRRLHEPRTLEQGLALQQAARRLSVGGLAHAAQVLSYRPPHPETPLALDFRLLESLKSHLSIRLTRDQSAAVVGIAEALRSPTPMNALLCGDVGSGKTVAFALPVVAAHLGGARVAIVAPTDILADQLASKIQGFFPQARVHRAYAGDKRLPAEAICVGTTGMSTVARKCDYQPNVLIVDEQHKMALAVRRAMAAPFTHVLEASATPIPHALASTLYAGTQVFTIKQAPVERQISSFIYDDTLRSDLSRQMRNTMADGGRVLIIYPRVNAAHETSVERASFSLSEVFPGKVGHLHGKLSDGEIRQTLQSFRTGDIQMLVASTIVETGIDVPDVRLLVVREADRFGIAQLHQLRGRLARNGGAAHFAMHVDDEGAIGEETLVRLATVARSNDGFDLAEEDMRQRGFGDLLGEQQNGGISLPMRLLRLSADEVEFEMLELAIGRQSGEHRAADSDFSALGLGAAFA